MGAFNETRSISFPANSPGILQLQYAEYLSRFPWSCFATLTFRQEYTIDRAYKHVFNFFDRRNIPAFIAIESGDLYGRIHAHALAVDLSGTGTALPIWENKWREYYGIAEFEPYQKEKETVLQHKDKKPIKRMVFTVRPGEKPVFSYSIGQTKRATGAIHYVCKYVIKSGSLYDFINMDKIKYEC